MSSELVVRDISKRYGPVQALDRVSARFVPGEIHAVLGENGAGKSTLMGVLAGFVEPDSGTVHLDGKPLPLGKPQECRSLGIELIHQHFALVPEFTVRESLALSALRGKHAPYDAHAITEAARRQAASLGWSIPFDAKVRDLPVGAQQRVELLKALAADARILILDEPTAVLSPDEVQELFQVLRGLRAQGRTLILIAHKLSEVFQIADRVTVLRRGKWIAESLLSETDPTRLAAQMVGELPQSVPKAPPRNSGPGLEAQGLHVLGNRGEAAIRGVSFQVARGEILGFGGVDGNGQVELAEALAGVRPVVEGRIVWLGSGPMSTAYIPQDRREDGLALEMSVQDNLLISGHRDPAHSWGPWLRLKGIRVWAQGLIDRFSIKVERPEDRVGDLSGGNQQKVVVSRALETIPDLLVAVNPTRGLDLKATQFVHEQILHAREEGAAVVLVSTDLDELAALADRTLFLSRGELSGDLVGSATSAGGGQR